MTSINPHITFNGNAREAMSFYQAVFGGELELITADDQDDAVFHADLQGGSFRIMGADSQDAQGDRVSLHIRCDDKAELEEFFNALSEKGTVHCSVCEAFGGWYGQVTDRFGIQWFLTSPS